MVTQSADTDPKSEHVLVQALRALPVWRRLAQVDDLHAMCEALALSDLRRRDPEATEEQLRARLLERILLASRRGKRSTVGDAAGKDATE
jgi:hypothetical protein